MRISQLSQCTGVPVATIKFYLREQLLPPGVRTARNQARYGIEHVERLQLMQVLTAVGGVGIASVRSILEALDDDRLGSCDLRRLVLRMLYSERSVQPPEVGLAEARRAVDAYLAGLGWTVDQSSPARDTMAMVLMSLRQLGWECDPNIFTPLAEVAERLAVRGQSMVASRSGGLNAGRDAVIGTVLMDSALIALRRLAEDHHAVRNTRAVKETTGAASPSQASEIG